MIDQQGFPGPVAGRGGPRSEPTRRAILAAARARFAGEGYDRTTIRAVARDAGVDASMVMRYYGSKDQLFAAAIDVDLQFPDLSQVPEEALGEALVRHFLRMWEGDAASGDGLRFLFRSALTNETAAELLRTTVFRDQVARLVGGVAPDRPAHRAGLVVLQLLGLALCRYVLQLGPVAAASPETLVADLAPGIQRALVGPLES